MSDDRFSQIALADLNTGQPVYRRTLSNFFFPKRLPKFNFPPPPVIPNPAIQPDAWRKMIQETLSDGYISDQELAAFKVPPGSTIARDVDVLNRVLISNYLIEDHEARYRQNQYFLFQWEFTLLAFVATITATLATLFATNGMTDLSRLFGVITAVVAGFTALFVNVYNRERPQRKWFERRRVAESLRKQYFLYLMHMVPYDTEDHEYLLTVMVDRVRNLSTEALPSRPNAKPRKPHVEGELETLVEIYLQGRVRSQMHYYKVRSEEYDFNADWTFIMAAIIPLLVTVLSALNTFYVNPILAGLMIILPSFATLFLTFQRIYDWERQNQLYDKAYHGLQTARIIRPGLTDKATKRSALVELVDRTEGVLASEADQWGTALAKQDEDLNPETVLEAFMKKSGLGEADEQTKKLRQILKLDTNSSLNSAPRVGLPGDPGTAPSPAMPNRPGDQNTASGPDIIDPLSFGRP
jgi:hypothetical protein